MIIKWIKIVNRYNEMKKTKQIKYQKQRKEDAAKVTTKVIIIVKTESPSLAS